MNARLQEKIDEIKKNLRDDNDFHPLLCFDVIPRQIKVELSADYQSGMKILLKLIEYRDFLAKELPNFSFEDRAQAQRTLTTLTRKIEKLETLLGNEYDQLVKDQLHDYELNEATWSQDQISRELFIMVKHLKPHIFEGFKRWVFNYMTDEEIKEELKIIKHREETELEAILAADICEPEFDNPHYRRQSPYDLYNRYTLYLANEAYETDDHFKEIYETIKTGEKTKGDYINHLSKVLPIARQRFDEDIRKLESKLRKLCLYLCDYSRERVRTGKFQRRKDASEKKIADYEKYLSLWRVDCFVHTKHMRPHLYEELKKRVFKNMSDEEVEEFNQKVSECEEKKLEELIQAVNDEIH